jgi:hypothetical protein
MSSTSVLIAYDGSGSTGGCAYYHDETQRIVSQYSDARLLFWDSTHRLISHNELRDINTRRQGYGGTAPQEIAKWVCENDFHGHLIIITDGEVSSSSMDSCTTILSSKGSDWQFEHVDAHLIGGNVNMSVTCPFTRASPHNVYLYEPSANYERTLSTRVSTADLELLTQIDRISSLDEFQAVASNLESVLVARTMGTEGNMELRDKLLALKKRINSQISAAAGESDSAKDYVVALRAEPPQYDAAIRAARQLTNEYYASFDESDVSGSTWSSKLSRMIAMTEGALRGVFSMRGITAGIQSDRVRRAASAVAPTEVSASPASGTGTGTENPFVCPITLDTEHDVVLLVKQGPAILADVEKRIVDDVLDCPLNLLKYSELVTQVVARLDLPMSLNAFTEAQSIMGGLQTSPMTRDPILSGALCFGAAADHVKATQWTLAQLFTGGKSVGNPDFWFAIVWHILNNPELCPTYLQTLKPYADTHMRWRLTHQSTFIGLSGLPEFPTTRVPLDCAIWYVLASPLFSSPSAAGRDVLRGHMPHLAQLLELVAHARLDIPSQLQRHYVRLRTMLRYLSWIKADRFALPMWTRMLIQAHIPINRLDTAAKDAPQYIPIDGPPSATQIMDARHALRTDPLLTTKELVGIAGLVSPLKSAGDIALPLDISFEDVSTGHVIEWNYGLTPQERINLTICPQTCRPLYMYGEETWREKATRKFGPVEKQISVNAYFGKYVQAHGAYPSRTDLLIYIYKRCVVHGQHTTLPACVMHFIDEVCADYAPIVASITPVEFIARWRASVSVEDRKRLEVTEA